MSLSRSIDELFDADSSRLIAPVGARRFGAVTSLFAATIFLSAFLLFLLEPVIGKFILPWFGGLPAVWTTCLLFFQAALFAGYGYAHLLSVRLGLRMQATVHGLLLLAACLFLPIIPNEAWKPSGDVEPISRIVVLLSATIGLPFFVLSSTGPLLQRWFSRTSTSRTPYRLYALSNIGSLLALLSFPVIFEQFLGNSTVARVWSWTFVAFAALCGGCALVVARAPRPADSEVSSGDATSNAGGSAPSWGTWGLWFALATVPSILLLATTNAVCQDIASAPFLWIVPLALYLLSFILCFDSERWYSRRYLMPAAAAALLCEWGILRLGWAVPLALLIVASFAALFICAMVCHGELARRKPNVAYLTSYYLVIAAGGAAGGIFVGVVAPRIFPDYYELPIGLFACGALMLAVLGSDWDGSFRRGRRAIWAVLVPVLGVYGLLLYQDSEWKQPDATTLAANRSFFGVLRVLGTVNHFAGRPLPVRLLRNGHIAHGLEFLDAELAQLPTTYYSRTSGIGRLLGLPHDKPRAVGLIGLGAGELAVYAQPGDRYRFYEINPNVERFAREYFHFLDHCRGHLQVVHGDGRLQMERETPQNFDVIVVDAFSGDAIPVHLLTLQAFGTYLRHLAPDGVIAVHITNSYFALQPVVEAIAEARHLGTICIHDYPRSEGATGSHWMLVAPNPKSLERPAFRAGALPPTQRRILWTDDYASLFSVWERKVEQSLEKAPTVGRQRPLSRCSGRPAPHRPVCAGDH